MRKIILSGFKFHPSSIQQSQFNFAGFALPAGYRRQYSYLVTITKLCIQGSQIANIRFVPKDGYERVQHSLVVK
tara:strand:- start:3 stop:224 length:222 start_codon:yes stop_codon:yes gene_type:complete